MAKVLVTGGVGFIGYHLSRFLSSKKHELTVCDNLFRGRMDNDFKSLIEQKNVSYIQCDLTNQNDLSKLESYDYVYHLAAINGTKFFYEMPDVVLKVNILSAINVLEWFKSSNSRKILFSSSSEGYAGAYGLLNIKIPTPENVPLVINDVFNERFSYAGSKIAGELLFVNYARKNKFKMSIIRYHNIYGPRMGYEHVIPQFVERAVKKEDPFNIYGGEETRAFCYVEDAILATSMVMESQKTNNEIVHIGTMDEIKIKELARKVVKAANYSPQFRINKAPKGSVKRRCPDTHKLKKLTGFASKINLDEGIKRTFEWYKKNPKNGNV